MPEKLVQELRDSVLAALPDLDVVIGWGESFDPLRTVPVFVRNAGDVAKLTWSPFCVQNLAGYLVKPPRVEPGPGKKIGIFARGCDSRSLVALIQEKFITRESIHIFGVPCGGTVDWRRVARLLPGARVQSAEVEGESLKLVLADGEKILPLRDVLARRCLRCVNPNPVISNVLIGKPIVPVTDLEGGYRDVEVLEALPLEERLEYWKTELGRCMRCYACRNACPLCVCQEKCIAETREPSWVSAQDSTAEKVMFHAIHALHLAGRCTECGECERACPVGIPVALMKEKLARTARDLLGYEAGLDPDAVPPLLGYNPADDGL